MPKAYILAELIVADPEAYRASGYMALAEAAIAAHDGRYLVRGGNPASLEGTAPERFVILEFPDRAAAERFFHSEEYTPARTLRNKLATGRLVLLDGA